MVVLNILSCLICRFNGSDSYLDMSVKMLSVINLILKSKIIFCILVIRISYSSEYLSLSSKKRYGNLLGHNCIGVVLSLYIPFNSNDD